MRMVGIDHIKYAIQTLPFTIKQLRNNIYFYNLNYIKVKTIYQPESCRCTIFKTVEAVD